MMIPLPMPIPFGSNQNNMATCIIMGFLTTLTSLISHLPNTQLTFVSYVTMSYKRSQLTNVSIDGNLATDSSYLLATVMKVMNGLITLLRNFYRI